jgi:acyl-coenzyme A thioesterase PaaI-like protein
MAEDARQQPNIRLSSFEHRYYLGHEGQPHCALTSREESRQLEVIPFPRCRSSSLKLGRGTIHGAVSATIVDWSGGLAISTHGLEKSGASVDIHVTYIGTAQLGDLIEIEATANKVGRSMAFTTIRIYKLVDGKPGPMVATASHTKYIQQAKP